MSVVAPGQAVAESVVAPSHIAISIAFDDLPRTERSRTFEEWPTFRCRQSVSFSRIGHRPSSISEDQVSDFNEQVRITTADGAVALVAKANATAVSGVSKDGFGVEGRARGSGVVGVSETWIGVYGESTGGAGTDAVRGQGKGSTCGVAGHSEQGIGVYGKGQQYAARFDGRVLVSGNVRIEGNLESTNQVSAKTGYFPDEVSSYRFSALGGDYAETFASEDEFEPGTVLVIGNEGLLTPCGTQYDTRATGVVSGAGGLNPGSVMQSNPDSEHHVTLALAGQVYVKADPQYGAISTGDLLTTSPTEGCAMRVSDRGQAVGAILGKALSSLEGAPGLLRMLVTPS
ncbi:hypothetical protein EF912_10455 [Streptomyces sp. WAC07061]|uniref:hypothetical protein n=1 Tax=Streptomyces sp. WAC07061 TaxID=2487410 RepID=UPI000F77E861|nr:hypothetical protein [Streptomyces sp. WAC07061]RSS60352.1 hypothetical protein EF912_10455 [Streptomyces sp. WAC07061]